MAYIVNQSPIRLQQWAKDVEAEYSSFVVEVHLWYDEIEEPLVKARVTNFYSGGLSFHCEGGPRSYVTENEVPVLKGLDPFDIKGTLIEDICSVLFGRLQEEPIRVSYPDECWY